MVALVLTAAFLAAGPTVRALSSDDDASSSGADAATAGSNEPVALVCFRDSGTERTFTLHRLGDQLKFGDRNTVKRESDEFSGPVIATIRAAASLWSDFEPDIATIEAITDGSSTWTLHAGNRESLARSAGSDATEGFVVVWGTTGLVSETVYLFRTDGWEYAVLSSYGRPVNVPGDDLHEYRSNAVMAVSPSGQQYRYEGAPLQSSQGTAVACQ